MSDALCVVDSRGTRPSISSSDGETLFAHRAALLRFSGAQDLVRHSVCLGGAYNGSRSCGSANGALAGAGVGRRWRG